MLFLRHCKVVKKKKNRRRIPKSPELERYTCPGKEGGVELYLVLMPPNGTLPTAGLNARRRSNEHGMGMCIGMKVGMGTG